MLAHLRAFVVRQTAVGGFGSGSVVNAGNCILSHLGHQHGHISYFKGLRCERPIVLRAVSSFQCQEILG